MDKSTNPAVVSIGCTDETLRVEFDDGRTVLLPLWWYPRLLAASPMDRANWELLPNGVGVHWPTLDEDLSAKGFLIGGPAPGARPPAHTSS